MVYFLEVLSVHLFLFTAAPGLLLCVGFLELRLAGAPFYCGAWAFCWGASLLADHELWSAAHGLSCPVTCGTFPDRGSNPCLLHQQLESLTTGPSVVPSVTLCCRERTQGPVGMGQWPGHFQRELEDCLPMESRGQCLLLPAPVCGDMPGGWQPWVSPSLGVQGFSWGSPYRCSPSRGRAVSLSDLSPPPWPTLLAEIPSVVWGPRQTNTLLCGRTLASQELGAKVKQPWARLTL